MNKKIFISGSGGQGVKLLSFVLSNIISEEYNVSLVFDYDAAMRGGTICSHLIYSDERIENPVIEEVDIHLKLSEFGVINAKKTICQTGTCDGEEIDFNEIAQREFGNKLVINMIAIGVLLKEIDLDLSCLDFEHALPEKNKEQNLKAITHGYNLR